MVATEAFDDFGLPHTLEHLVFLGSRRYPFKGVLDVLANRCFAQGTNASTDTDHTTYTLETAGSEGFLHLLPIYVDHILFPTLTDDAFLTEVHHVNGNGEDAGVVYCEMQGRQNGAEIMAHRRLHELVYGPPSKCSYASETGGTLEQIRLITPDMVRAYHAAYYTAANLCVIVTGSGISAEAVFEALSIVEDDVLAHRAIAKPAPFLRPFVSQPAPPPLAESVVEIIAFPDDDASEALSESEVNCARSKKQKDIAAILESPVPEALKQAIIEDMDTPRTLEQEWDRMDLDVIMKSAVSDELKQSLAARMDLPEQMKKAVLNPESVKGTTSSTASQKFCKNFYTTVRKAK